LIAAIGRVLERGQDLGIFSSAVDVTRLYMTIFALSMFYFTNASTMSAILGRDLLRKPLIRSWREHVVEFIMSALETNAPERRGR
jgi:TetR/AcrR family transcriptional regulator